MATTRKSRMPSDDQMLADRKVATSVRDILATMRQRYPQNPDLMMAERCLGEFSPAQEWEPQPGAQRTLPPRETMADKAVQK